MLNGKNMGLNGMLLLPPRMTRITGLTIITIPRNIIVLIRKIPGVIVFMALYATEQGKIPRRGMAICAGIPFPIVFAAKNGKIQLVMLRKIGSIPTRVGRVAGPAVGWEIARFVVGTGGCLEIGLVAGKAIGGRIQEISTNMTLGTVVDLMPTGQGKKQVVGAAARPKPARAGNVVAFLTIG